MDTTYMLSPTARLMEKKKKRKKRRKGISIFLFLSSEENG